jgi:hypothetical protein
MAVENIGTLVPTKIPGLADPADIQAAFKAYHYGSYTFNTAETNTANLINPSIAYTINDLQVQITAIGGGGSLAASSFNAKGDLLSASANDTLSVVTVGANGTILTANSATASGLSWATPEVDLTNSVTLTNKTLTSPLINLGINANTATTYTFVLSDNGKLVTSNNASAQTLSIPTNASVAFPIGTQINVAWITGAGQPTIQAVTSGTTTVLSTASTSIAPKLRVVNSVATCVKIATDTWLVTGDLA